MKLYASGSQSNDAKSAWAYLESKNLVQRTKGRKHIIIPRKLNETKLFEKWVEVYQGYEPVVKVQKKMAH